MIKKIISIVSILIVSLIIGVSIYSWNAASILGDSMPMPFKIGYGVILSGSMEPNLSVNDLVIVKKSNNYQVNDIVVYQSGYDLITHRIVKIDGDWIITKGDANNIEDDKITKTSIKGKVILVIPYVGIITNILKQPIGIVIMVALSVILLELSYKNNTNKKEELEIIKDEIDSLKNK